MTLTRARSIDNLSRLATSLEMTSDRFVEMAPAHYDDVSAADCCWLIQEIGDRLGQRSMTFADDGTRVETLRVRDDLASLRGFGDAVRRAAGQRAAAVARVHVVEGDPDGSLALQSEVPNGVRVSEMVGGADDRPHQLQVATALGIEILSALRSLSQERPPIVHGAITAERIVLTDAGRVVFIDGALGSGLRLVERTPDELWRDLRIARPAGVAGASIGAAGDILQGAVVILELLLGRRLGDADFPGGVEAIVDEAAAGSSQSLASWFKRALGLASPAFANAAAALDAFLQAADPQAVEARPPHFQAEEPVDRVAAVPDVNLAAPVPAQSRFGAVILVSIMATAASVIFMTWLARPAAARAQTGQLSIVSTPPADVSIDGLAHGRTPVRLPLASGRHTIHLQRESSTRDITVTVAAGSDTTHYVEMPSSPEAAPPRPIGQPPVSASPAVARTETAVEKPGRVTIDAPFDVDVVVDGTPARHGSGNVDVTPGPHIVEIVNANLGVRIYRPVKVQSGRTTEIAIDTPQATANFNALPWADVSLDGRSLGQTPLGNVPVSIGNHEIVFSHPDLGTVRRVVTVTATAPLRVSVDLRSQR